MCAIDAERANVAADVPERKPPRTLETVHFFRPPTGEVDGPSAGLGGRPAAGAGRGEPARGGDVVPRPAWIADWYPAPRSTPAAPAAAASAR